MFFSACFLTGFSALCSGCYTLKQGTAMLGYLNRTVPLEELKSENSGEDLQFVQRVEAIRRFAMDELGLKESKNYTRYVELDRDYLAAVVSASAKDSFSRFQWWFPVVGRVPYKGFFNVNDARKEWVKLEKKDLDVWVRGVDAFSTLGWFRDPLYSYMKKYSDKALAELIIHELFHATVYLKNHSQFNEELAEFVGNEGGRLYIEKTRAAGNTTHNDNDSGDDNANSDRDAYLGFIRGLIAELEAVYKSDVPREEKLKYKEEIIGASKARFEEEYNDLFTTENYRFFSGLPVNNAYLDLFRLYHEEDRYFKELYVMSGSDLPKFIAVAKTIRGRQNPKEEFKKALGL
ncbi:MAG: aminopeptidase [Treponema sp.]|nr:aminopeptidase [Treponema sp.]